MKIMRVFVNFPNHNWYELQKGDYIFDMPILEWLNTNPKIEIIERHIFIPIAHEGIEYNIHISNFIFS